MEQKAGPRASEPQESSQKSGGLVEQLSGLFAAAAQAAFPELRKEARGLSGRKDWGEEGKLQELPPPLVTDASKPQFGDFQYNSAMQIAQVCFHSR